MQSIPPVNALTCMLRLRVNERLGDQLVQYAKPFAWFLLTTASGLSLLAWEPARTLVSLLCQIVWLYFVTGARG
jgi:hypothetical protein